MTDRLSAFRKFNAFVLGYTVLVVLWGAYVRATGSGAGCGGHWPLCNGEVVPRDPAAATMIEFAHRVMSALSVLLVGALIYRAFRLFPRGHRARRFAALGGVFLALEAMLGAGLVVFGFVADNASAGRAFYLAAHLANTLILLGVIALTGHFAVPEPCPLTLAGKPKLVLAALPVAMLLCVTGALAAFGDTLLLTADTGAQSGGFSLGSVASSLVQLRLIHPPVALAAGAFLLMVALRALKFRPTPQVRAHVIAVMVLVFVQLIAGAVNIALKAPVWMQLLHLLLADLLWLALVVLVALTFTDRLTLKDQIAREA